MTDLEHTNARELLADVLVRFAALERRVAALEEVVVKVIAGEESADPFTEGFLRHQEKARKLSGG